MILNKRFVSMKLKYDNDGKSYCELTDEEAKNLGYYIVGDNGEKIIHPSDCEHDFKIASGFPRNIKYCTKCILRFFTLDEPTELEE